MSWEQPEARPGRTAVFLLVAAILVATALAIALVVGVASQSSLPTDDAPVLSGPEPRVSSDDPDPNGVAGPVVARVSEVAASASISVPAIQLDAPVFEGVEPSVLDSGPGHWPGTAAPGGLGNLVIAEIGRAHV